MKNIFLAMVAGFGMGNYLMAGGNIDLVEPAKVTLEEPVSDSGFYLGLGYGNTGHNRDYTVNSNLQKNAFDKNLDAVLFQAGYKINSYFAVEGRYWLGLDDTIINDRKTIVNCNLDTWAVYLKPMYPVTEKFDVYALLGYGKAQYDLDTTNIAPITTFKDAYDGFSWGLGATYNFTNNISVFVDYVNIYDDDRNLIHPINGSDINLDEAIDMWSIGITYKF
jgi:opacity protein-like surface antigen